MRNVPAGATSASQSEAAQQVVVVLVAQLVAPPPGAPGRAGSPSIRLSYSTTRFEWPEPVDVGVHGGRAAARVHPVDLPHVHVAPRAASSSTSRARWPWGSFSKSLKSGSITTGKSQIVITPNATTATDAGRPPAAREAPHQRRAPAPRRSPRSRRRSPPTWRRRRTSRAQSWVDRPTSTRALVRQADSGSSTTTSTSEMPAPAAAPPRIGRARRARSISPPRRARSASSAERARAERQAAEPDQALGAAEILRPVELGGREVRLRRPRRPGSMTPLRGRSRKRGRPGGDHRHAAPAASGSREPLASIPRTL